MDGSITGTEALAKRLAEAEVLAAVIDQLRELLAPSDGINMVPQGGGAFEGLREQVLPILEEKHSRSVHALQVAMYRVDLSEQVTSEAMRLGGLRELAGRVVLRALQKVLTRMTLR